MKPHKLKSQSNTPRDAISLECPRAAERSIGWAYHKAPGRALVETATWAGDTSLGLSAHFHDEAQLVLVMAGARAFRIGSATLVVEAGQCLYIPSQVVHQALEMTRRGTVCVNAYISIDDKHDSVALTSIRKEWLRAGFVDVADLIRVCQGATACLANRPERRPLACALAKHVVGGVDRIEDIAGRLGVTREGFSRRFAREVGMAPHALRIAERLNRGKSLLRVGQPIAMVASEAGFADQSHFGRLFRLTFGTTPAGYSRK
jgi:AraC-like DNA-binding protein/mannose-6-phosphate isomerase-like protein (cupin superfamily)